MCPNADLVDPVEVKKCNSWLEYMTWVEENSRNRAFLYRGQRDANWPVESTLLRATKAKLEHDYPDDVEMRCTRLAEILEPEHGGIIWQAYAKHLSHRLKLPESEQEVWMLGRHDGLLTPFIDWSRSPYVAAFFGAVGVVEHGLQSVQGSFAVFALNSFLFPHELGDRSGDNSKLRRHALQVDPAAFGIQRAVAQSAVATYITPATDVEGFVRECEHEGKKFFLRKVLLPNSIAEDALAHLHHMTINYASLFPDPFGIAQQANLNHFVNIEGMGNWMKPPGFQCLTPVDGAR